MGAFSPEPPPQTQVTLDKTQLGIMPMKVHFRVAALEAVRVAGTLGIVGILLPGPLLGHEALDGGVGFDKRYLVR